MSGERFVRLLEIMARLRAPDGCPWDREQDLLSLRPYLIEETYEVLDAIERRDWEHLPQELGDLQLQIVFQAQIAAEEGRFTVDDVLEAINRKLVRRHPHVFGDGAAATPDQVARRWEEIKAEENRERADPADAAASILADVPRHQPALVEAHKLGKRAARVGFDWPSFEPLLDKLREEAAELVAARDAGDADALEDEVGDLLFMAVNIARFLKTDPESALKRANRKFRRRFEFIERELRAQGRTLEEASLDEMEELWQRSKSA